MLPATATAAAVTATGRAVSNRLQWRQATVVAEAGTSDLAGQQTPVLTWHGRCHVAVAARALPYTEGHAVALLAFVEHAVAARRPHRLGYAVIALQRWPESVGARATIRVAECHGVALLAFVPDAVATRV